MLCKDTISAAAVSRIGSKELSNDDTNNNNNNKS